MILFQHGMHSKKVQRLLTGDDLSNTRQGHVLEGFDIAGGFGLVTKESKVV